MHQVAAVATMGEENEVEKPSTREAGETAAAMDKVRLPRSLLPWFSADSAQHYQYEHLLCLPDWRLGLPTGPPARLPCPPVGACRRSCGLVLLLPLPCPALQVTDVHEEKEMRSKVDKSKVQQAMAKLAAEQAARAEATRLREKELAAVKAGGGVCACARALI